MAAYIHEEQLGTYWNIGDHLFYIVREEGKVDKEKMIAFEEEQLIHKVLPFVENGKQLVLAKCVVLQKNNDSSVFKLGILKEDGTVGRTLEIDVKEGEIAELYRNTYYQSMGKVHSWQVHEHIHTVKYLFHRIAEAEKDIERFYKLMYSRHIKQAVEFENPAAFKQAYIALFSENDYEMAIEYVKQNQESVLRALPLDW